MTIQQYSIRPNETLSYSDIGPEEGYPILVQHGMIASIQDTDLFDALVERNFRVISIARPGYGDSSPIVLNSIGDWGKLIRGFVEALSIAKFAVLGISSGAPYSYSIAWELPKQVEKVYILSGTPDLSDPRVQSLWPFPLNQNAKTQDLQGLVHEIFFKGKATFNQAEIDSQRNHCFGIAQDLAIRVKDWGFALKHLEVPVILQHSRDDGNVPLSTAVITQQKISHSQLKIAESQEHFSPAMLTEFLNETVIKDRC